ncbi:MAG TPA: hypothetical protein VN651_16865 [Gemmatimonadaceae bacterium]|nr:hypothetical protein [Gemmatimonadaceae bacterium]
MSDRPARSEKVGLVRSLSDRLLLTIAFFESAQEFPSGAALRSLISNAAAKGDLRQLRLIEREVDAMTSGLSIDQLDGLNAALLDRLGIDRSAELAEIRRQVRQLVERGALPSEKARQRAERHLEMLEASGDYAEEVEILRRLLSS